MLWRTPALEQKEEKLHQIVPLSQPRRMETNYCVRCRTKIRYTDLWKNTIKDELERMNHREFATARVSQARYGTNKSQPIRKILSTDKLLNMYVCGGARVGNS